MRLFSSKNILYKGSFFVLKIYFWVVTWNIFWNYLRNSKFPGNFWNFEIILFKKCPQKEVFFCAKNSFLNWYLENFLGIISVWKNFFGKASPISGLIFFWIFLKNVKRDCSRRLCWNFRWEKQSALSNCRNFDITFSNFHSIRQ